MQCIGQMFFYNIYSLAYLKLIYLIALLPECRLSLILPTRSLQQKIFVHDKNLIYAPRAPHIWWYVKVKRLYPHIQGYMGLYRVLWGVMGGYGHIWLGMAGFLRLWHALGYLSEYQQVTYIFIIFNIALYIQYTHHTSHLLLYLLASVQLSASTVTLASQPWLPKPFLQITVIRN